MIYPYVPAKFQYGRRTVTRGLLFHMAEGGHTVGYLSRNPARGVSVHFVIEYSGRTVRMLPLSDIAGGINPRLIRRNDDPTFLMKDGLLVTYGITAASKVLGGWVTNPNNALVQVEIEGFARRGPNLKQVEAMKILTENMLDTFPTIRGVLAHRDLQRYKACPGRLIPWKNIGGHGRLR